MMKLTIAICDDEPSVCELYRDKVATFMRNKKVEAGIETFHDSTAFVNYFPAQFLLRKEDMNAFPDIHMYIAPVVGVVLYLGAYLFWRFSLKFYKSTGN